MVQVIDVCIDGARSIFTITRSRKADASGNTMPIAIPEQYI